MGMTQATYEILPGWYDVPGTDDVRWWNGAAWSPSRLVADGSHEPAPRTDAWVAGDKATPALVIAAVFAVIGALMAVITLWTIQSLGSWVFGLFPLLMFVFAALMLVVGLRTRAVVSAPGPTHPPQTPDHLRPLPGDAEGPGAGWYPAPTEQFLRWWTGTRWAQYVIERGTPVPTHDVERVTRRALAQMRGMFFGSLALLVAGIICAVVAPENLVGVGVIIAVMAVIFAGGIALVWRTMVRSHRRMAIPAGPPEGRG